MKVVLMNLYFHPLDPRSGSCPPCSGAQARPGLASNHLFGAAAWAASLPGSRADVVHQGWHAVRIQSQFGRDDCSTQNHSTVNQVKSKDKEKHCSVTHNAGQTDVEKRRQHATGKRKVV